MRKVSPRSWVNYLIDSEHKHNTRDCWVRRGFFFLLPFFFTIIYIGPESGLEARHAEFIEVCSTSAVDVVWAVPTPATLRLLILLFHPLARKTQSLDSAAILVLILHHQQE